MNDDDLLGLVRDRMTRARDDLGSVRMEQPVSAVLHRAGRRLRRRRLAGVAGTAAVAAAAAVLAITSVPQPAAPGSSASRASAVPAASDSRAHAAPSLLMTLAAASWRATPRCPVTRRWRSSRIPSGAKRSRVASGPCTPTAAFCTKGTTSQPSTADIAQQQNAAAPFDYHVRAAAIAAVTGNLATARMQMIHASAGTYPEQYKTTSG